MKTDPGIILPFPSGSNLTVRRRALRKDLRRALRASESPVIVDLAGFPNLDCDDIDLLLDCLAQAVGHSVPLILVAVSPAVRVLLDVIRVSSLVPVVSSMEEALGYPRRAAERKLIEVGTAQSFLAWSA